MNGFRFACHMTFGIGSLIVAFVLLLYTVNGVAPSEPDVLPLTGGAAMINTFILGLLIANGILHLFAAVEDPVSF